MSADIPPGPGEAARNPSPVPRDPAAPPAKHPRVGTGQGAEENPPSAGSLIILGLLLLVGAFVVWKQFLSSPEPAKAALGKIKTEGKAKPARKTGQGRQSGQEKGGAPDAGAARRPPASAKVSAAAGAAPVTSWSVRAEEPGEVPQDPEAYAFARVPWENPESKALEERVRRLGEGFDRRPMAHFHAVEGRTVFLRQSIPVLFAKDRKLDRISEPAVSEYLPEWYQRGFTLHSRGHREPFSPRTFRLRMPPGVAPPPEDGLDHLVNYAVYADVEQPGALLIYPHSGQAKSEGANGFVAAEELRAAAADSADAADLAGAGFGLGYFRRLTGGRIDSLRAYALADRGFVVVEAHARRAPPGMAPQEKPAPRHGAFLFLVKPGERRIAFLVHDFDAQPCRRGKKIRFQGVLDVDGDETPELLLGPRPAILVHEDAEGIKYHYGAGYACEE